MINVIDSQLVRECLAQATYHQESILDVFKQFHSAVGSIADDRGRRTLKVTASQLDLEGRRFDMQLLGHIVRVRLDIRVLEKGATIGRLVFSEVTCSLQGQERMLNTVAFDKYGMSRDVAGGGGTDAYSVGYCAEDIALQIFYDLLRDLRLS